MKRLNLLLFLSSFSFGLTTDVPLRSLYLKAMQEPTGKHFQLFQKSCKANTEKLKFVDDLELLGTLKPKKRHLGVQVHVLVITYLHCLEEASHPILEDIFAEESLNKNLKKFISMCCKEGIPDEDLKKILLRAGTNREHLIKRLKAVTIPGKCSEYKTHFEKVLEETTP